MRSEGEMTKDWDEIEALRESLREHMAEIHRLRAAVAEASMQRLTDVQQEMEQKPVAWLQIGIGPLHTGVVITRPTNPKEWNPEWWRFEPLYTHPPRREWVGLTNDEREEIEHAAYLATISKGKPMGDYATELMRVTEAKMKGKNT